MSTTEYETVMTSEGGKTTILIGSDDIAIVITCLAGLIGKTLDGCYAVRVLPDVSGPVVYEGEATS